MHTDIHTYICTVYYVYILDLLCIAGVSWYFSFANSTHNPLTTCILDSLKDKVNHFHIHVYIYIQPMRSSHPCMDICTDSFMTFQCCIYCSNILALIQLLQYLTHVIQPGLTQSSFAGKLFSQLKQLLLPAKERNFSGYVYTMVFANVSCHLCSVVIDLFVKMHCAMQDTLKHSEFYNLCNNM